MELLFGLLTLIFAIGSIFVGLILGIINHFKKS